ncbi:hypothetical protein [Butyrivibrio sp. LC3010]|uniref:hypothetical protein n=1 Tax=Butyrivibrio sp. LC3010 TaxID=1280680 RepID=UPI0004019381|nr:hypothetical protein [Butyrivibrio sp. LC3010]
MKRRPIYSTHIGAASILLIFLVLSLISFAALALVNSRADYILSKKMFERSISYFEACHEANGFIAENDPSFYSMDKDTELKKSIPLSDFQTLDVSFKASGADSTDSLSFKITEWCVVTHDEKANFDETLPVMKSSEQGGASFRHK